MKKIIFLFLSCILYQGLSAQQTGIKFEHGNWEALLAKAKATNEIIFMDAYTTWCGPCIMMSRDVFTNQSVGKYYNENFLNVKLDMEEGIGLTLAKKYQVEAYPSLLFINGEGDIVHRATGYHDVPEFLNLGETALNPDTNLKGMGIRYAQGDRSPDFVLRYISAKYSAMEGGILPIAEAYLRTQKDWGTLPNMQLLYLLTDDPNSKWFDYLVENRLKFEALFGKENMSAKFQDMLLTKALSQGKDVLAEVERFYTKVYPEMAPKLSAHFKMNYYQYAGDLNAFAAAAVGYLDEYPSNDADELNNIAWTFYESIEDQTLLKKALTWAARSVDLDSQYNNNDTLAALYFKLGKKRKARKTALAAIAIAKLDGVDYSGTQALLQAIEGK
ncbi:MAG: thioredoxin family protein [Saprospiraceae bacterium]